MSVFVNTVIQASDSFTECFQALDDAVVISAAGESGTISLFTEISGKHVLVVKRDIKCDEATRIEENIGAGTNFCIQTESQECVALHGAFISSAQKKSEVKGGDGYCPLPVITSDLSEFLVSTGESTTIIIEGYALGQISAVTSDNAALSINIVSKTFTSLEIEVLSSSAGDFELTLDGVCGSVTTSDKLRVRDIVFLRPGDNVDWERVSSGVTVGNRTLVGSSSYGWNKGASFGTVPANEDFTLSFKVDNTQNAIGMIGVDASDPDHSYTTSDYCIYCSNGQLYVYENGAYLGSFGNYAPGDTLQVKRTGTTITYHKNDDAIPFYTSNVASSSSMVFDSSIYYNLSISEIVIWHTN